MRQGNESVASTKLPCERARTLDWLGAGADGVAGTSRPAAAKHRGVSHPQGPVALTGEFPQTCCADSESVAPAPGPLASLTETFSIHSSSDTKRVGFFHTNN